MRLDSICFQSSGHTTLNPNTHQKSNFCAGLHQAAALALFIRICPDLPGAAS